MRAALGAALAALLPAVLAAAPPARTETKVRYTPADRAQGRYQYVPVEVPPGTTSLTVAYAYDKAGGANVVDLGLFEPGSLDLGTLAFRGWSGGERTEVTLSGTEATPGYWPGPIPAGRWHVALGLYKVADAGVEVTVTVEARQGGTTGVPALAPRTREPLRRGTAWYSGALHTHTVNSDGALTVAQLAARAREAGLDFLAVTDHNNTTHQLEAVPEDGLLRIVGEEVTTPGGHASVWGLGGLRDFVDFRVLPGDPRIAELVRAATSRGALFSLNHPASTCVGCGWEHAVPDGVTGIEVTNGKHGEMVAALEMWDRLLQQGRRIVAVGSSDWHRPPSPLDLASVRVKADELSTPAILDGIRAGRVVVMADGRTPPPELVVRSGGRSAGPGETLKVDGPLAVEVTVPEALHGGRVDLVADGRTVASRPAAALVAFDAPAPGTRYVRVHVLAADGTPRALTNPVFLETAR